MNIARWATPPDLLASGVAKRWKAQYERNGWQPTTSANSRDTYDRLVALGPDATAVQVNALIGNDTWTTDERCVHDYEPAVVVIQGNNNSDEEIGLCRECAKKLLHFLQAPNPLDA